MRRARVTKPATTKRAFDHEYPWLTRFHNATTHRLIELRYPTHAEALDAAITWVETGRIYPHWYERHLYAK